MDAETGKTEFIVSCIAAVKDGCFAISQEDVNSVLSPEPRVHTDSFGISEGHSNFRTQLSAGLPEESGVPPNQFGVLPDKSRIRLVRFGCVQFVRRSFGVYQTEDVCLCEAVQRKLLRQVWLPLTLF